MNNNYQCPCTIADKPCNEYCYCIKLHSSRGCKCCARYGSEEQQKLKANLIVSLCNKSDVKYEYE